MTRKKKKGKFALPVLTIIRSVVIFLLLAFCSQPAPAQNNSVFFFNEVSLSLNRTFEKNNAGNGRFGFGLGVYHVSLREKTVNLLFGFEYNRTTRFIDWMYEGHFAHSADITWSVNTLSIPFFVRVNAGKHVRYFAEAGVFLDLNISARRKGTMYVYDYEEWQKEEIYPFNDKPDITTFNYGFSAGVGISIPISKIRLILRPDYKFVVKPVYDYYDQIYNRYFMFSAGLCF
jgi:hypothetical protein